MRVPDAILTAMRGTAVVVALVGCSEGAVTKPLAKVPPPVVTRVYIAQGDKIPEPPPASDPYYDHYDIAPNCGRG